MIREIGRQGNIRSIFVGTAVDSDQEISTVSYHITRPCDDIVSLGNHHCRLTRPVEIVVYPYSANISNDAGAFYRVTKTAGIVMAKDEKGRKTRIDFSKKPIKNTHSIAMAVLLNALDDLGIEVFTRGDNAEKTAPLMLSMALIEKAAEMQFSGQETFAGPDDVSALVAIDHPQRKATGHAG